KGRTGSARSRRRDSIGPLRGTWGQPASTSDPIGRRAHLGSHQVQGIGAVDPSLLRLAGPRSSFTRRRSTGDPSLRRRGLCSRFVSSSLFGRRFPMEPRPSEKSLESRSEVQTSPTRQPERKRRFQIIKLEERIAPGGGNGNGSNN